MNKQLMLMPATGPDEEIYRRLIGDTPGCKKEVGRRVNWTNLDTVTGARAVPARSSRKGRRDSRIYSMLVRVADRAVSQGGSRSDRHAGAFGLPEVGFYVLVIVPSPDP